MWVNYTKLYFELIQRRFKHQHLIIFYRGGKKFSWVEFILFLLDSFSGCDGTNAYGTECCTPSHHCGIFEGHCDSHQECIGHLRCGANNCFDSFPFATNDCCFDPVPSMFFSRLEENYYWLISIKFCISDCILFLHFTHFYRLWSSLQSHDWRWFLRWWD